jgi:nitroreductase
MTVPQPEPAAIPAAGIDLFEAIYTTRAMRRVKPDPIPDDVLRAILDAAIRAPSGGNSQGWAFIVVRDPDLRAGLAAIYRPLIESLFTPDGPYGRLVASDDPAVAARTKRMMDSALYLGQHMQDAPVIVVPCLRTGGRATELTSGASIFPAVQNLMLAARAFGVGSTLTTIHRRREAEVKALLGVPDDYDTAALIPLGYPRGRWGLAARTPVEEVAFGDRWGAPL